MTTERTPQDVLRELRALSENATPGPWVPQSPTDGQRFDWYLDTHYNEDGPEPVWADSYPINEADIAFLAAAVNYVRDMLDKAIAEAPDSPRGPEAALLLEAYDDVAPDSRHKISGDYGDLPPGGPIYVDDDEWDEMTESEKRAVAAPDTLSEKPGLDVERLAKTLRRMGFRSMDSEDGFVSVAREAAAIIAAEYNRLGSTDSEGR